MEDYIFLIIAVAISIFAAINKSQKAKMADQPVEEQESKRRNFFMDQLLGEDFLEDTEEKEEKKTPPMRVQPAAQPVPSKVNFKSSKETQKGLNYQLPKFKSTLPDRPKHVTIVPNQRQKEVDKTMVDSEETVNYLEDFSLRKAVVYSLIMERKY